MLFSSVCVLCIGIENEILKDFKNETIDESEYENDFNVDNDEKSLFDIIGKHFSVKKNTNNSFNDEIKNLFNSFLKSMSINENIFKQVFENIKSVEVMKQKFDEFIDSLELPNDCLASFVTIINAMVRSELWAFKCKFENITFGIN
jgi:hypothetical protein